MTIAEMGLPFFREYKGKKYVCVCGCQPDGWPPLGVYTRPCVPMNGMKGTTYMSVLWRLGEDKPILKPNSPNDHKERKNDDTNPERPFEWKVRSFAAGTKNGWNVIDCAKWHLIKSWTPTSTMDLNEFFVWNSAAKTQMDILIRRNMRRMSPHSKGEN